MKYIRTKDGKVFEKIDINTKTVEEIKNLWCDFKVSDGTIHFVDYFPKEKEVLKILQREIEHIVFVKKEIDSDSDDYIYEPIDKEEILKQADTIEELCDEFVFLTYGEHCITPSLEIPKQYKENYANITFGAIWTDKGLIYIAKMNDKGELELLWKSGGLAF